MPLTFVAASKELQALGFIVELDDLPDEADGVQKLQVKILVIEKAWSVQSFQKFR